jgi:hypothetical protein
MPEIDFIQLCSERRAFLGSDPSPCCMLKTGPCKIDCDKDVGIVVSDREKPRHVIFTELMKELVFAHPTAAGHLLSQIGSDLLPSEAYYNASHEFWKTEKAEDLIEELIDVLADSPRKPKHYTFGFPDYLDGKRYSQLGWFFDYPDTTPF